MSCRVFVVTGSNKGIGKSIVKLLLKDAEQKIVYMTSRNEELGRKAVKDLEEMGLKPKYHQLDITDQNSINNFRDYLTENHGGLDVLMNNAGIVYNHTAPFAEQAEETNKCNFFATLNVCDALFPLLKPNGRVVHVSSSLSESSYRKLSADLKAKFSDSNLTIQGLKDLMSEFTDAAKENKVEEKGWPMSAMSAYGISKLGVSIMTMIQHKMFDEEPEKRNIFVNSCCPGFVKTDLTGNNPSAITPDEGADTPTFLALLPINAKEPRGQFCQLRNAVPYPPLD